MSVIKIFQLKTSQSRKQHANSGNFEVKSGKQLSLNWNRTAFICSDSMFSMMPF